MLRIIPITFRRAAAFLRQHHRHHGVPVGCRFCLAVETGLGELVGVAFAGRPVARRLDDGRTLEVTRCCTNGHKNACSMLYGACRRIAKGMGYRRIVTYTLATETGTSLKAAGWVAVSRTKAGGWHRASRPRCDKLSVAANEGASFALLAGQNRGV